LPNQGGLPTLGVRSGGRATTSETNKITNSAKEARVEAIARQLSDLLARQMRAITGRGLDDLTQEEVARYELRKQEITELSAELKALAYPN